MYLAQYELEGIVVCSKITPLKQLPALCVFPLRASLMRRLARAVTLAPSLTPGWSYWRWSLIKNQDRFSKNMAKGILAIIQCILMVSQCSQEPDWHGQKAGNEP